MYIQGINVNALDDEQGEESSWLLSDPHGLIRLIRLIRSFDS
jgi:hypothetical protein